jgi:7-cyano-7-deazaguanine synthase
VKDLAIVLVSGGMDSATVAAIAQTKHENLAFLHISYGQKTANRELACFKLLADDFKIPIKRRLIVNMSFLQEIGGNSLTDRNIEVAKFDGDIDNIPSSYVPFRNSHIISTAVSWAEVIGAQKIYIGANHEDSPGYPDCRPEYYEAFNQLINKGTKEGTIQVLTPIIAMTKEEIIQQAMSLKTPLEHTWSCYARSDKACGVCDSCALRLRAFKKLGLDDPIEYV